MKKSFSLIASFFFLYVIGCSGLSSEKRDWKFMQSVGGISIGQPVKLEGSWYLPINCDVSGTQSITAKPTTLNSGLVCDVVVSKEENFVFITVQTALAGNATSSACAPVNLGHIKSGKYFVAFKNADEEDHLIGTIEIGL